MHECLLGCPYGQCVCLAHVALLAADRAKANPLFVEVSERNLMKEKPMGLKRREPNNEPKPSADEWIDKPDKADYPTMYAFLHDRTFDDKTPRQPGSISIFCRNGVLTASINDKELKQVAYCSALSLGELLASIETVLNDDDTEWKGQAPYQKQPPY